MSEPLPVPEASTSARAVILSDRLLAKQRAVALGTVLVPAAAFAGGLAWISLEGLAPGYLALWLAMHVVNTCGISVGFHRLATHRSFACGRWTRRTLLIMGSMGAQGPVIHWTSNHRRHHHTCDAVGDVHSPLCDEDGRPFRSAFVGFWHAHVGWLFRSRPTNPVRYTLDLIKDTDVMFVNRHYMKWVALGIVLPGAVAAAFAHTWQSFLLGALVGGLMRVFLAQHVTWFINSLTHMFGRRTFSTPDRSTNLTWLALPSVGESWHNNHHAFPYSARLGLTWRQPDPGWWLVVALRTAGLAWDIKTPTAQMQASKRRGESDAAA